MSFPIGVKQEEFETPPDDFNVATDESENEDVSIDIDSLQLLDPKFASKSKFPVGCIVWFDARKSRITKVLRAKSGTVVGVYFDLQCMRHVYRVKSSTDDCDHTVSEDRLMYGVNCPVKVTNLDTNEVVDGIIVVPKIERSNDGKQIISYAVQFTEGRHVSVEFLVAADRIKYREEEMDKPAGINDGVKDKDEINQTEKCDTEMKESESKSDVNQDEKTVVTSQIIPSPLTASNESKGDDSVSKEGSDNSTRQVAVKSDNDGVGRSSADNLQYVQQPAVMGVQSNGDEGHHALRLTLTGIDNQDKEIQSSPLGTARWKPPTQDKSPPGKGGHGIGEGLSSFERKRSMELELKPEIRSRPSKMIKAENTESKEPDIDLWCRLTIPKWLYRIRGRSKNLLFRHLVGVGASKMKRMTSMSNCKIQISGHDAGENHPMTIEIASNSMPNVEKGIGMIEDSLANFLSNENAEKKMLYELISSAKGSHAIEKYFLVRDDKNRMLRREYEGIKSWCALFDLPYKHREGGREYHGRFLTKLKPPGDCKIEVFGDEVGMPLEHTSPFVLIRGTKKKDVLAAGAMVWSVMKKHQGRGCGCLPQW